jgi:hypothetical protein
MNDIAKRRQGYRKKPSLVGFQGSNLITMTVWTTRLQWTLVVPWVGPHFGETQDPCRRFMPGLSNSLAEALSRE